MYWYYQRKDSAYRSFSGFVGGLGALELLRSQTCEIDLIQIVPGYFLFLLFICCLLVGFSSLIQCTIPFKLDKKDLIGSKTSFRANSELYFSFSSVLFFIFILLAINSLLPIGLDSFEEYGESTLDALWSFDEILAIETVLITALLSLSQSPLTVLPVLIEEEDFSEFFFFWKQIIFFIVIVAGLLTPTVDAYTQSTLASYGIGLYLGIFTFVQKRVDSRLETSSIYI